MALESLMYVVPFVGNHLTLVVLTQCKLNMENSETRSTYSPIISVPYEYSNYQDVIVLPMHLERTQKVRGLNSSTSAAFELVLGLTC